MKSPMTKEKYIGRLNKFFDFFEFDGSTPEEKSRSSIMKYKERDSHWVFSVILKFMQFQLERVQKREITGSTVNNYLKSIKLFCEMDDISLSWKKISRGHVYKKTSRTSEERVSFVVQLVVDLLGIVFETRCEIILY